MDLAVSYSNGIIITDFGFVIEALHKSVLGIHISKGTNMFVVDNFMYLLFMYLLIDNYERYVVYTDGGTWYA